MIIRRGSIPSCSATRGAGYAWNARRSTRADPTKRESTSFLSRPSTSSKRAFPASWTSSLYVAWRTPHFVSPTPTIATLRTNLAKAAPVHKTSRRGEPRLFGEEKLGYAQHDSGVGLVDINEGRIVSLPSPNLFLTESSR